MFTIPVNGICHYVIVEALNLYNSELSRNLKMYVIIGNQPWGIRRFVMKWTGVYLVGFVILLGGLLAALWKIGVLDRIGTTWTLIGIAIAIGIGIMLSVANSGSKENIEIDRK
jgi:hypothetical protein